MEILTVHEAAEILSVSDDYLRKMMQFKLIDIGSAVKIPGKTKYHYIISRDKLNTFLKGGSTNG